MLLPAHLLTPVAAITRFVIKTSSRGAKLAVAGNLVFMSSRWDMKASSYIASYSDKNKIDNSVCLNHFNFVDYDDRRGPQK